MVYSDFYDTPKSFWMILCLEMDIRYDKSKKYISIMFSKLSISRNVFLINQVRSCIICITKKVAFGNVQALFHF